MYMRGYFLGRIFNLEIYCYLDIFVNKLLDRRIYMEGKIFCFMVFFKFFEDKMVYFLYFCLNGNKSFIEYEG